MAVIRILFFLGTAFFTLVTVNTAPARYDQRQEGDFNLQAKLENLLFVVTIPSNNDLLADLALEALELKQHLGSRSSSSKEEKEVKTDDEIRGVIGVEPLAVEIIQINENHSNKGSSVQKGDNKDTATVSNQQAIFSFGIDQQATEERSERVAKNVNFDFPKSREEPTIMGYFIDAKQIFRSKIKEELERARNVVESRNIESRRPETLKRQLIQREEDGTLPSNADKDDDSSESENKPRDECRLIGDSIENCGPGRHRDASCVCQFDDPIPVGLTG